MMGSFRRSQGPEVTIMPQKIMDVLMLGRCSHEFSWPRRAADGEYYQVCLLCAAEYKYDWTTMRRTERGRYVVTFEPLAAAREVLPGGALTERYVRAVEAQIGADPSDWTWSHRRWNLRRPVYAAATDPLNQGPA